MAVEEQRPKGWWWESETQVCLFCFMFRTNTEETRALAIFLRVLEEGEEQAEAESKGFVRSFDVGPLITST